MFKEWWWYTETGSEVKLENELEKDLAEVVADLKRQLLLSKFCVERFKTSDDDICVRTQYLRLDLSRISNSKSNLMELLY